MNYNELVALFLKRSKASNSQKTTQFYEAHTRAITNFFNKRSITDLDDLTFDDVLDFINGSTDIGISNKTINHRVNIIKQLIDLQENKTYDHYLIKDIKKKAVEPKSFMPLQKNQLFAFIDWVKALNLNDKRNLKKACQFLICVQNGIRANELLELKPSNLLLDDNRIKLGHTKNHIVRYAYFNEYTKGLLKQYLSVFKPKNYLFENEKHEKNAIQTFVGLFDVASKQLGFKVTSHMLRATFATTALRNGCNIESVRVMMGHTSVKTTQMYLHMTDEELYQDNLTYNPLAWYEKETKKQKGIRQ